VVVKRFYKDNMLRKIGILALQGDFLEHKRSIQDAVKKSEEIKVIEVRTVLDLDKVSGLIIPGGESTTIGKLLKITGLDSSVKKRVNDGMLIYGTCAGAIILADSISGPEKANNLHLIDIEIQRNAYGRQMDSFITEVEVDPIVSDRLVKAVFIRAPIITSAGEKVKILALYDGKPVLVQEGNVLVSTFHPELTDDIAIHRYFLDMIG